MVEQRQLGWVDLDDPPRKLNDRLGCEPSGLLSSADGAVDYRSSKPIISNFGYNGDALIPTIDSCQRHLVPVYQNPSAKTGNKGYVYKTGLLLRNAYIQWLTMIYHKVSHRITELLSKKGLSSMFDLFSY